MKSTLHSLILKAISEVSPCILQDPGHATPIYVCSPISIWNFFLLIQLTGNSVIPTYFFRLTSRILPPRSFTWPTPLFLSTHTTLSFPFLLFSLPHPAGHVWKHPVVLSLYLAICVAFGFLSINVSVCVTCLRADLHLCRPSVHTGPGTQEVLCTCSVTWNEGHSPTMVAGGTLPSQSRTGPPLARPMNKALWLASWATPSLRVSCYPENWVSASR